jgi:MFS family permease
VTFAYRRVLSLPGALAFSATGVIARLPMSMVSLGVVVLVSTRTGSYGVAGGVAAAYVAATAVGAVPLARLVDRLGQGRVLGVAASVSSMALALLVLAVERSWGGGLPHVFAVLAGLTMPNVGAAVRQRWSHAVRDRTLLDTAFAVEAVNDEIVFILGPTLVTLLATGVHPYAGIATAAVASVVGTWTLVAQRRTEPPRHPASHRAATAAAMPWRSLLPLVTGGVMLGVLFGGCEVAVVAFAEESGQPASAGLLLAVWALGSLLAGVISGAIVFRRSPATRYRVGVLSLALLMLPLPFVEGIGYLAVLLFLAGFAISPTMIAAVSWVEAVVPRERLNEGMVLFSTGMVIGVAPGAASVGAVVDLAGASTSFWIPAAAGLTGAALAFAPSSRRASRGAGLVRAGVRSDRDEAPAGP